jgi:hypothetical protein
MFRRFAFSLAVIAILSACLFAQSYDGPAQLPTATVASALADTPAPGATITVNSGDDLQAALNNVQCGNTIQIQAGATFVGKYRFPVLPCDDQHWIIVRTSSPDTMLPAEGHRLTPCYAGIASLPGRPQYPCNNPQNFLARLVVPGVVGPVVFQNGANHYRLIGLELTRQTGTKGSMTLVAVDKGGAANHIILDRSWLHGTPQDETQVGFSLSGTHHVAVVDSYFSDFHCTSRVGNCMEAHAISAGTGNYQDGVYKIQNNFLESSSQSVMFGGAAATTTPTDITIRSNHFFKPWIWMKGNDPFQGGAGDNPFIVRHSMEFKNAVRVLIENNLVENTWGGAGETGYAILLTPKNQHTKSGRNVCPVCQVTDVTIRYSHVIHAGGGIEIETVMSGDGQGGGDAMLGARFSIHDVVLDDISRKYKARGRLFQIANTWLTNPLNTITIDHITGFPDPVSGIFSVGNTLTNPQMYGFIFTNNIVTTGKFPIYNRGGGRESCAFSNGPLTVLNACFGSYTFNNNALLAASPLYPEASWPTGNFFAQTMDAADFVQCDNGNGGNYQLQDGSPYKNMGTDGRDLGADIPGLNAALAGVE